MAENNTLPLPPVLFDYLLYYECAQSDWIDYKKKFQIKGDGSLMNYINWNCLPTTHPNDTGGPTKCGVIEKTWKSYSKKPLAQMNQSDWQGFVQYLWENPSYGAGAYAANYACGLLLFQTAWGGFGGAKKCLQKLKDSADKKDYPYINSKSIYKNIADATHAFTDPMVAFNIIRNSVLTHYYNISTPTYINSIGKKNDVYRMGWFNRVAIPFTPYGFYLSLGPDGKYLGLRYESTIEEWDSKVMSYIQNGAERMVKIFDWGIDLESISELIANIPYDPSTPESGYSNGGGYSGGGSYSGCGSVSQLGNYSNAPDANIIPQQKQSRDEVLNTLMGGSYTPGDVKTCDELITTDKKKNKKRKSEN